MKKTVLLILLIIIYVLLYKQPNYIDENNYQKENNNSNIVGTIIFENVNKKINLTQANDNKYFLDHDEYGNKSIVGSVFLDYRNNLDDRKLLIYGHNSETIDTPFHFLENYLNEKYIKENNLLILEKNDTKKYYYQLFTVFVTKNDLRHINLNFNNDEYYNHILWLKKQSLFEINIPIFENDSIILMQTCYYEPDNSYLIIGFKRK